MRKQAPKLVVQFYKGITCSGRSWIEVQSFKVSEAEDFGRILAFATLKLCNLETLNLQSTNIFRKLRRPVRSIRGVETGECA